MSYYTYHHAKLDDLPNLQSQYKLKASENIGENIQMPDVVDTIGHVKN